MTVESATQASDLVATVQDIRSQFPALARRYAGHPVAYLDGPGGTQVPSQVVEAMVDYLYRHNANTHWSYPTSRETDEMLFAARGALADFLHAAPDEIAFGANMTTLTFHVARALGRQWSQGDEVIVTELDHHANIAPWRALTRERGIVVRSVPMVPETGELDLQAFERMLTSRTRLVAVGAASNALGTVTDVAHIRELARTAGAMVFVDAVHCAPHVLTDVRALGCDFLVCSPYKFYGPHVGVLYGRKDRLRSLDVPKLEPAPDTAPERVETGTLNHEGIVGAAAAVDFLASLGSGDTRRDRLSTTFAALHERGANLVTRLWRGLGAIEGVRTYGPAPGTRARRTPTVSFTVRDRVPQLVAQVLAERGVFVSHGDFYASTLVERLGQGRDGLVRAGCACYTTEEEVERLIEGVGTLV